MWRGTMDIFVSVFEGTQKPHPFSESKELISRRETFHNILYKTAVMAVTFDISDMHRRAVVYVPLSISSPFAV
jgi:hypothetical protein